MGLLDKFKKDNKTDEKKIDEKSAKVDVDKKDEKKQPTSAKATAGKSMKDLYDSGKNETGKQAVKTDKLEKDGDKKKVKKQGNAYKILARPLITEKATDLGVENKYVFEVSLRSNKIEIAKAINEVYGIKPVSVNIIKVKGKKTRYGKTTGKRKDWKKAIIQLPEGKSIKVYEGV